MSFEFCSEYTMVLEKIMKSGKIKKQNFKASNRPRFHLPQSKLNGVARGHAHQGRLFFGGSCVCCNFWADNDKSEGR